MKRVYAIDVPMMTMLDVSNASALLDSLQTIQESSGELLLANDDALCILLLDDDSTIDGMLMDSLLRAITNISISTRYDHTVYSPYITHQPCMQDPSFPQPINEAIGIQMCALHVLESGRKAMMLLRSSRWPAGYDELNTSKDKKPPVPHPVLTVDKTSLGDWLKSCLPQYVPWRHGKKQRGSVMRPISQFSAGGNPVYAQELLEQAYSDSIEDNEYPKYLYTYDMKNECFVQYRFDRNKQYHGMDIDDDNPLIPDYLHKKYHR